MVLLAQNSLMANKPAGAEKRIVNLGVMIGEETKRLLLQIAEEDSRSVSWVAYELVQRGIAQFKRDGLVREPDGGAVTQRARKRA